MEELKEHDAINPSSSVSHIKHLFLIFSLFFKIKSEIIYLFIYKLFDVDCLIWFDYEVCFN